MIWTTSDSLPQHNLDLRLKNPLILLRVSRLLIERPPFISRD